MQKVERSRMPEPRITISFKPPPCLQGFELPLKDHIVSGIGIRHFLHIWRSDVVNVINARLYGYRR
jgi:hypothetical protein